MQEKISYLKDIPFLQTLTKTALGKFSCLFKECSYKRGQSVYIEGQPWKYVFIVKEGEFELQK